MTGPHGHKCCILCPVVGRVAATALMERWLANQKKKAKEKNGSLKEKGRNKLLRKRTTDLREMPPTSIEETEPKNREKNIRIATQNIRGAVCAKAGRIKKIHA